MALVCNIDQRGRTVRYRIGVVLVSFGLLGLLVLGRWLPGGLLLLAGLFSLFEANRGWCAVRALGFKTKL